METVGKYFPTLSTRDIFENEFQATRHKLNCIAVELFNGVKQIVQFSFAVLLFVKLVIIQFPTRKLGQLFLLLNLIANKWMELSDLTQ